MADGVLSRKTHRRTGARRGVPPVARIALRSTLLACGIALAASPLLGQQQRVTVDGEVFRKTADGRRLAELALGSPALLVRSSDGWAEVRIEGWVPSDAVGATTREGFNAIVIRSGGQTLHAEPGGAVLGRLLNGFLLDRFDSREGWTRVQRTGWVRSAALEPVLPGEATVGAASDPVARPPAVVAEGRRLLTGDTIIEVQNAPAGARVATVEPGTPITVVERGNQWTRVRLEGWVRSDRLATSDPDSLLVDVSAAALRANPDDYTGMRVRWTVQFVALERAEPERTDFYEGEPFLLARAPDPGEGFVYVAVPPELMGAARELRPLQRIEVLAQVRTGRSALMGVPVLDLLALF